MSPFTTLERTILKAKGLSDEHLARLDEAGIASKADFGTVGDAATLVEIIRGLEVETASKVMAWATGSAAVAPAISSPPMLVDSADLVYCSHCNAKQPKDYRSGDLCVSCGQQAEAILSCYWCHASGPGQFCRQCGAAFVATADLDLAVHLKREGLPKDAIPERLKVMSPTDREALWGRIRKLKG